jgi:glycosyltransferase involved in cell wall biosynthesis
MTPIVPRIAVFSIKQIKKCIQTSYNLRWMADQFEIHFFNSDIDIEFLYHNKFSLAVVIGNSTSFKQLKLSNIPTIHFSNEESIDGDSVYNFYISSVLEDNNPIISIFTPAYKSFDRFIRAFKSMQGQSLKDWEWIILDDSPDDSNYLFIKDLIKNDHRIKLYRANKNDGFIGSTKRQAASLCSGKYLLELDHDDELHHLALELCVEAFKKFPDAGFCYSNSCETFEDGGNVNYGDHFAMGFGKHYDFKYQGKNLLGADTPINASTMRHIVGVPNHFRCWERDIYFRIHRHNNKLPIVDDYELLVRTFLYTKMIHIPEVLYIQYMNSGGNNTQEPRRAEIQRLVDKISLQYDKQIHDRIIELGGTDWLWDKSQGKSNTRIAPPKERSTLAYVYKL